MGSGSSTIVLSDTPHIPCCHLCRAHSLSVVPSMFSLVCACLVATRPPTRVGCPPSVGFSLSVGCCYSYRAGVGFTRELWWFWWLLFSKNSGFNSSIFRCSMIDTDVGTKQQHIAEGRLVSVVLSCLNWISSARGRRAWLSSARDGLLDTTHRGGFQESWLAQVMFALHLENTMRQIDLPLASTEVVVSRNWL